MYTMNKSWSSPHLTTKKYLSRELMYHLSKQLDASNYEVVPDGDLDLYNKTKDQPDLVVYERKKNFAPVLAVEICTKEEFKDLSEMAGYLLRTYHLQEFFIYNVDEDCWYSLTEKRASLMKTSFSEVFKFSLRTFSAIPA